MRLVLPVIVVSQFFCTSLWFAGNAIAPDIARDLHLEQHFLAHLTSAIQFGFISGTLCFAVFSISDRFSPSLVFFCSSIFAGLFNLGMSIPGIHTTELLLFRFLTGFFLAGIYPVGMKIASDHYKEGLGKSLGFLVGALVLGTAFPHLLKNSISGFPWRYIVYATTALSGLGGLCILLFVPNGPYRKAGQKLNLNEFMKGFRLPDFRAASFGYFGHMWELYTFWAFLPLMLMNYNHRYPETNLNVSLWSFLIIASGGLACVFSGVVSQFLGAKKVATIALSLSCLCCVTSPLFLLSDSIIILIVFLIFWGLVVIADSPLFSTLVARSAPEESRGTSLTIVNCIGFSITIVSIQFINAISDSVNAQYVYTLLAIGPVFGLIALLKKEKSSAPNASHA
ncbi:MFS transporter [Chryseolinea soli]|uniref:MFS transporter n=1 Tax=Chryseolinea soli TaxID=2321403 RepID=A0A385SNB1_9BACT|nr:MFS transporter [Chryseolinea soli]AYB30940.1 MFS transporter [Chryseolinea soli]